jgi:hypothetical protein
MARTVVGLIAPERVSRVLARSDHEASVESDEQLRAASPSVHQAHIERLDVVTVQRLRLLRRRVISSVVWLASAVAAAVLALRLPGPRVSGSLLAIGSVLCFAAATLGRLGWEGQSVSGRTAPERLDRRVLWALYWLGMYLATASLV